MILFVFFRSCDGTAKSSRIGTQLYMSPQVFKGDEYTKKADVWSGGLLFLKIMILDSKNLKFKNAKFNQIKRTDFENVQEQFNPLIQCICSQMVVLEEDARSSICELVKGPIFHEHFVHVAEKNRWWTLTAEFREMEDRHSEEKQAMFERIEQEIMSIKHPGKMIQAICRVNNHVLPLFLFK